MASDYHRNCNNIGNCELFHLSLWLLCAQVVIMGKVGLGFISFHVLCLLCAVKIFASGDNCTKVREDLEQVPLQRTPDYDDYYYQHFREQSTSVHTTSKHGFRCHDIDLSYLTWILPPNDYDLVELTCISCKVDNLPTKLSSYANLSDLTIANSTLDNITNEMFRAIPLANLSIIYSGVSYVEDNLLNNFQTLNLSFNRIENIFLHNSSVVILDLSFNLLQNGSFPKEVQKLYLKGNQLIVTEQTFAELHVLEFLDISNNNLSVLPEHVFIDLIRLQTLNISYNNLVSLDYGSFSGLFNLLTLDIAHNCISTIPEYVFLDIHVLRGLYINHNKLSDLNGKEIADDLRYLTEISINNNPWNCDVLLLSIRALKSRRVRILPGFCKTTPNIMRICCNKNQYSVNVVDDSNPDDALSSIRNFYNRDFTNSKLYNFFTKDYKQQNFWKYFDTDYKQGGLFRFFDSGFLQSQFYRYFNRDYFNITFQNKIIDKIENISQEGTNFNVTELKDTLKNLFRDFFYTLNTTSTVESLSKGEELSQYGSSYNKVLIGSMATAIVLLVLYIISEKCKLDKKNSIIVKLKRYRIFRPKTAVSEPEIEIL